LHVAGNRASSPVSNSSDTVSRGGRLQRSRCSRQSDRLLECAGAVMSWPGCPTIGLDTAWLPSIPFASVVLTSVKRPL